MLPWVGPNVWKVPDSDGLVLAVAPAAGSPSVSPEIKFQFPRPIFVTGMLTLLRPADGISIEEQMAQVAIRITDETGQAMIGDTRGTLKGTTNAPVAAPLLLLAGFAFNPWPLQRPVASCDKWFFSFQNEDPENEATLAGLFLYFEEAFQS